MVKLHQHVVLRCFTIAARASMPAIVKTGHPQRVVTASQKQGCSCRRITAPEFAAAALGQRFLKGSTPAKLLISTSRRTSGTCQATPDRRPIRRYLRRLASTPISDHHCFDQRLRDGQPRSCGRLAGTRQRRAVVFANSVTVGDPGLVQHRIGARVSRRASIVGGGERRPRVGRIFWVVA
jgi:hypothetical protein